jgi:alpha-D-ribose 1-methylphosphonate 5-triphosphate synthase subunit PhnI
MTDMIHFHEDDDESFCEGDPTLDDLDPDQIQQLAETLDQVNLVESEEDRTWVAAEALKQVYGEDLVVP